MVGEDIEELANLVVTIRWLEKIELANLVVTIRWLESGEDVVS